MGNLYRCILLFFALLYSCSSDSETKYFCDPTNQPKNIKHTMLSYDTLGLDSIHTSYLGITVIRDNKLLYVDKLFGWLYEFDNNGKLLKRHLGRGNSLSEVPIGEIEAVSQDKNNNLLLVGSSYQWVLCDSTFRRTNSMRNNILNDLEIDSKPEILDRFNPYTFMYDKFTIKEYGNNVYLPIIGDSKIINSFMPTYQPECKILVQVDKSTAKMKRVLGRLTPEFIKNKAHSFVYFSFDIDQRNGDFYVAFEIDSLIYVYDKDFNIKHSFGYAGVDMDLNYVHITPENLRTLYRKDRKEKAYYDNIQIINDKIFRTYKKGTHSKHDGLQVYEDGVLIADVETPKDFTVIGYIAPYYITSISSDEVNNKQWFYKFKL